MYVLYIVFNYEYLLYLKNSYRDLWHSRDISGLDFFKQLNYKLSQFEFRQCWIARIFVYAVI